MTTLSLAVPAFAEEPETEAEPILTEEPAEPTETPAEPEPTEESAGPEEPEAAEEPAEPAEEPTVTQEPAETEAPPAEETAAPEEPEETAEPEPTEEPAVTEAPAETAEPEVTEEPAAEDIAHIAEEEPMPIAAGETYSGTCGAKGGKNLTWTLTSNGESNHYGPCYTLTISGTGKMEDYTYYDTKLSDWVSSPKPWIAWSENFYDTSITHVVLNSGITHIGADAFSKTSIQSIQIPDTVTSIGDFAFHFTGLTDITLPDSVKELGFGAFADCESLTAVDIPDGVTTISQCAFEGAGLRSLTLPQSVTTIEWYAFGLCDGLTSVEIPVNVKTLGPEAFANCNALTDITILRPDCDIQEEAGYHLHLAPKSTVIHGYDGSTAEKYANKYGYTFVSLGKAPTVYKYAAPANIAAGPASTGIKVSWYKVSGASKYRVYYRKDGGDWTKAGDTSKTSYTWTKAAPGTAYELTVRCLDKKSKAVSNYGETVPFTWAKTPSITLTNTTEGIKASWSSAGAEQYVVTVNGAEQAIASGSTIPAEASNTVFTVTVQAVDADGAPMSAVATKSITFLSAPVISRIERASSGIKISWDKVTGAAKYRVYYRTDPAGSWKKLANTGSTSYTWKKAKTGTKYYFSVVCMDSKYKKTTSAKHEKNTDTYAILAAPSVTLTNTTEGLEVSWKAVPAAKEYKVTVKQGDAVIEEKTVSGTEHTFTGALNDTTYKVTVEALGNEEWISNKVSSTKSIKHLAAPVIKGIEASSSGIKISWDKVDGASRYRVYYATKLDADGTPAWKKLANTKSTSYNWKKATANTTYYFTVVCMDSKYKKATSAKYDDKRNEFKLLKTPSPKAAVAKEGIDLTWTAIEGAAQYEVTVKQGKTVVKKEPVPTAAYSFTEAASGKKYTFTVQAQDGSGKPVSKLSSAKSATYIAPPVITSAEAVSNGIQVSWEKVKGASKYQVCYLDDSGSPKKIATVSSKSSSYTWKKAVSGTEYQIAVRCMDSKGKTATSALSDTKTVTYTK